LSIVPHAFIKPANCLERNTTNKSTMTGFG
jgi:hypothetical protein